MIQNNEGIWLPNKDITVFTKPSDKIISQRKMEGLQKLAEIKQWGLRNPTKFMERFIGVELLDVQNYVFMSSWNKMYALWLCTRNFGKDQDLNTPIPTPNGMKQLGDIKAGDRVWDRYGNPTTVIATTPVFTDNPCYQVIFEDDEKITCGAGHLWKVYVTDRTYKTVSTVLETATLHELMTKHRAIHISVPTAFRNGEKEIVAIERVPTVKTKCIAVNNQEQLYLCGEKETVTHNSTLLALYFMTRGMLLNNCRCYICAGTSDQSIETFEKIVSIAKKEIESFTGLTDVFRNEVVINMNNSDGFIRNPAGFTYRLYDGSFTKTLNSNVNAKRGKRAEIVCFDECGWLDEEVFSVIEPYTAQDKNFKMGGGVDVTTLPQELPNQLLYTSSASSIDSYYYAKYKEYSKAMILGSKQHFVADINCEVMFNATYRGKIYPVSLLTKEKVENALRENKEKALREYYNQFTSDGGADAIIKRSLFSRNSYVVPPLLYNDTNKKKFLLAYDPARSLDNSVVNIGEVYYDPIKGYKMRIVNLENFMDVGNRKKTPMRTPEQIKHLKQLLVDYNGAVPDYDNIYKLYIDAGSGGAGVNIADYLMEDWYEEGHDTDPNYFHRGLIDKEYSEEYIRQFPNAVNKVRLLEPVKYKSIIYEALIDMMSQDLIDFPAEYDNKGYLTMLQIDAQEEAKAKAEILKEYEGQQLSQMQLQQIIEEKMEEKNIASTKIYKLSPDEEVALVQIDNMKEEVVNMVRKKRESGKDSFELTKEKQLKLHDDRAYTLALLAYGLQEIRREELLKNKNKKQDNLVAKLPFKQGGFRKIIG